MTTAPWPEDPNGDMAPTLEDSIEAAKQRHPSGKEFPSYRSDGETEAVADVLTAADRCDQGCGAGALYRLRRHCGGVLDLCHHHGRRLASSLDADGWRVIGQNLSLMRELYGGRNRHQGSANQ